MKREFFVAIAVVAQIGAGKTVILGEELVAGTNQFDIWERSWSRGIVPFR